MSAAPQSTSPPSPQAFHEAAAAFQHARPLPPVPAGLGPSPPAPARRAQGGRHPPAAATSAFVPDAQLVARLGLRQCLDWQIAPLGHAGSETLIAYGNAESWPEIARRLPHDLAPLRPLRSRGRFIAQALAGQFDTSLVALAEARSPKAVSLRRWPDVVRNTPFRRIAVVTGLIALFVPKLLLILPLIWVSLALTASSFLRLTALLIAFRKASTPPPAPPPVFPAITVLVPLYREYDIAGRLIERLSRLDYPRERLEILLITEADDPKTRSALVAAGLPAWIRCLTVPKGKISTKPRAMNYALDFCEGEIIGIYDAEDAPEPDQLRKVAAQFAQGKADLACLQGVLDYYNPRSNLIARLFTAEYAAWFRVIMPALQQLRLPMPLGGTTLFIKRSALIALGGWDAHNVTEDADLGLRLARAGLRSEMLESTTFEEANCRPHAWMKQRSRWIKGHLLTWAIHLVAGPRAALRDLGWRGFLGYHIVFLGAQSQVLLAPLLWLLWAFSFQADALALQGAERAALTGLIGLVIVAEVLTLACAALGLARSPHRRLWPALAAQQFYYALGALAGWRAFAEAFYRPFYWAKTRHGLYTPAPEFQPESAPPPSPDPPAKA